MTGTVLSIVGARPQFIKAAVVSRAIRNRPQLREVLVHTGQHYDVAMSDAFFAELAIPPVDEHLGISGGPHGRMTGRMLEALERVILDRRPDVVLVFGDTNSTLAATLAAAKTLVPVAHVEAGLRSFNRAMPEEINRVVADHVSSLLFCPTSTSVDNLRAEGITAGVHAVGDVMYDAALDARERARRQSRVLDGLGLHARDYAVATVHRAENTDGAERLRAVVAYLRRQAREREVVFVVHPRTAKAAERHAISLEGLRTCEPLGYLDMTRLVMSASAVYTDSGGLQKEAYFHRVPCVTLRDETEWVETVEAGWNRLWTSETYAEPRREIQEYGEGDAALRIADVLAAWIAAGGGEGTPPEHPGANVPVRQRS